MAHRSLSPARGAALDALLRLDAGSAHFEVVMRSEPALAALDPRDAGLAWELVAGITRRRNTLDALLRSFSSHPLERLEPRTRAALRLGAYQLLFLERIPPHAAVDESVLLVAPGGRRTAGFVNAVLRRVAATGASRLLELTGGDETAALALRYSCPEWLVARWQREWGAQRAQGLMAAADRVPEHCLRVNRLVATVTETQSALAGEGVETAPPVGAGTWSHRLSDALLYSGGSLERMQAYRDGMVSAQSRGSQLVGVVAADGAADAARVADLCAAPGTKTSHLAALLPGHEILAVEKDTARAADMERALRRLRVEGVELLVGDATDLPGTLDATFDLVLLDAPCTGLGTLAERPDLRWRRQPGDVARMSSLQRALARRAARLLRPGGALVYAVCTLTREETVDIVEQLAAEAGLLLDDLGSRFPEVRHPELGPALLTLPDRDATSGFFIARLRRPSLETTA